jgi:hemerythrin-like domain-containing protein
MPEKSSRRHESLIPLSREHHYGLMLCLRIHRGLPLHKGDEEWVRGKAARAARFVADDLAPHFRAEEESLFPAMREFIEARELLKELLSEHRELEALAARLSAPDVGQIVEAMGKFADLLVSHIRKEENELFPIYERLVSPGVAAEVGREVRSVIGDATQPKEPDPLG